MDAEKAKVEAVEKKADEKIKEAVKIEKESVPAKAIALMQMSAPEDELAKEMTHDLAMNFNKIAPFGKEDTAKELQDHASKTQDTLVDAVENAEVTQPKNCRITPPRLKTLWSMQLRMR